MKAYPKENNNAIINRASTIRNSFVHAVIPTMIDDYKKEEIKNKFFKKYKESETDLECIYCGDKATSWDHFRPLVVDKKPTGYISDIYNFVPACSTCNSSKGNKKWDEWIEGKAKNCPKNRGIKNLSGIKKNLEKFEEFTNKKTKNIKDQLDIKWEEYQQLIDGINGIVDKLKDAQKQADEIKKDILKELNYK